MKVLALIITALKFLKITKDWIGVSRTSTLTSQLDDLLVSQFGWSEVPGKVLAGLLPPEENRMCAQASLQDSHWYFLTCCFQHCLPLLVGSPLGVCLFHKDTCPVKLRANPTYCDLSLTEDISGNPSSKQVTFCSTRV